MELYSVKVAAGVLDLAPRTIRYYIKAGRFKHLKIVRRGTMDYHYLTDATFRAFVREYERSGPAGAYYKRRGNV